jgi:hypothetical protein
VWSALTARWSSKNSDMASRGGAGQAFNLFFFFPFFFCFSCSFFFFDECKVGECNVANVAERECKVAERESKVAERERQVAAKEAEVMRWEWEVSIRDRGLAEREWDMRMDLGEIYNTAWKMGAKSIAEKYKKRGSKGRRTVRRVVRRIVR